MYLNLIKYGLPVILIVGAIWRYNYISNDRDSLRDDLSNVKLKLEQSEGVIAKERQNAAEVALRAQKFYEDRKNDQIELDSLRDCVANKSCGVRVVKGACPVVPSSGANTGGTEAADAADRRQFEQDYFSLLASIKETKRRYDWMQQELIARSHPDYCNANPN